MLSCAAYHASWYSNSVNLHVIQQSLTGSLESYTWSVTQHALGTASCEFPTNPESATPACEKDLQAILSTFHITGALEGAFEGFVNAFGHGAWHARLALKVSIVLLSLNIALWAVLLIVCMRMVKSWAITTYATLYSMTTALLILSTLGAYGATMGAWNVYFMGVSKAASDLGVSSLQQSSTESDVRRARWGISLSPSGRACVSPPPFHI